MKIFAVVMVRGGTGVKPKIKETLKHLKLTRANHCVVLQENPSYEGMLKRCKDYVTWGEIGAAEFKELLLRRGRLAGNKKVDEKVFEKSGGIGAFAEKFMKGEAVLEEIGVKPVFRLHPPRKGFAEIKEHYPRGALGYRGEKMGELLKRMM